MKGSEILRIVDAIHRDKNVDKEIVFEGIEQAILSAARKHFGEEEQIDVAIDRQSGEMTWEVTDRGWIAYLNDLHKGRDTGDVWRLFIDVFVLASLVFIGTGFVLLWLHVRNRPATWPLTGLGFLIPFLLALFFIH